MNYEFMELINQHIQDSLAARNQAAIVLEGNRLNKKLNRILLALAFLVILAVFAMETPH